MNCNQSLLKAYVDGQLGDLENILLNEHLKSCPDCRIELNQHIVLDWHLKSSRENIEIPEELPRLRAKVLDHYFDSSGQGGKVAFTDITKTQYLAWKNIFHGASFVPGRKLVLSFMGYAGRKLGKAAKKKVGTPRLWPLHGAGG